MISCSCLHNCNNTLHYKYTTKLKKLHQFSVKNERGLEKKKKCFLKTQGTSVLIDN